VIFLTDLYVQRAYRYSLLCSGNNSAASAQFEDLELNMGAFQALAAANDMIIFNL
jgi:hypothetical protein